MPPALRKENTVVLLVVVAAAAGEYLKSVAFVRVSGTVWLKAQVPVEAWPRTIKE